MPSFARMPHLSPNNIQDSYVLSRNAAFNFTQHRKMYFWSLLMSIIKVENPDNPQVTILQGKMKGADINGNNTHYKNL